MTVSSWDCDCDNSSEDSVLNFFDVRTQECFTPRDRRSRIRHTPESDENAIQRFTARVTPTEKFQDARQHENISRAHYLMDDSVSLPSDDHRSESDHSVDSEYFSHDESEEDDIDAFVDGEDNVSKNHYQNTAPSGCVDQRDRQSWTWVSYNTANPQGDHIWHDTQAHDSASSAASWTTTKSSLPSTDHKQSHLHCDHQSHASFHSTNEASTNFSPVSVSIRTENSKKGDQLTRLDDCSSVGSLITTPSFDTASTPANRSRIQVIAKRSKYYGRYGVELKRTPQRVQVLLEGHPTPVYLAFNSIMRQNADAGTWGIPQYHSSEGKEDDPSRTWDADDIGLQHDAPVEPTNSFNTSVDGERVQIVSGTYKGKLGSIVKRTSYRVSVRVDHIPSPRLLAYSSVRLLCGTPLYSPTFSASEPSPSQAFSANESLANGSQTSPRRSVVRTCRKATTTKDNMLQSIMGLRLDYVRLSPLDDKNVNHSTYAHHLFGDRVWIVKAPVTVKSLPPTYVADDGRTYELLCTKVHESKSSGLMLGGNGILEVTAQYILIKGPDVVPTIDLKEELNRIALFRSLSISKAVARLELLQSTARASKSKGREWLILDDLSSSDFELIPEIAHEGCGFIPREYITRFLGNRSSGRRTFAIQVRIFATKLGIFKGILMVKPDITKIQLPSSMQKVDPTDHTRVQDQACLVILSNGVFPSKTCIYVGQLLRDQPVCKSFYPKKLTDMIGKLWTGPFRVPCELVERYTDESHGRHGQGLKHAFVVGLADPTIALADPISGLKDLTKSAIPPGHIFVTGDRSANGIFPNELFVTRCPCTEEADGTMLPVIQTQPPRMSDSDWKFLTSLPFGGVIFGNPLTGADPPMSQLIANGDLDGDLYFICWNQDILQHIHRSADRQMEEPTSRQSVKAKISTAVNGVSMDWLRDAQHMMGDIEGLMRNKALIGKLYTQIGIQRANHQYDDSYKFGQAYKDSLDIGKHGGKVRLDRGLWQHLPEEFHKMLSVD